MFPKAFSFVDVETTGLSAQWGRVIEIGIIRVEENEETNEFSTLINPQTYIDPFIFDYTGIYPDELEYAPSFNSVSSKIHKFLKGSVFVAHNVWFDYSFVKNEFLRSNLLYNPPLLCTVKLSRALYPGKRSYSLDSVINELGISCNRRHRALDDAKVLWTLFQKAQSEFPREHIKELVTRLTLLV